MEDQDGVTSAVGVDEAWKEFKDSLVAVMDSSTDPVGVVLRSHLWLERELTGLVHRGLPQPDALDIQRMSFSQLLDLAQALRVVRDDFVPCLREINRLRNRIAHQIDAEPNETDQERLWSALPKSMSDGLQDAAEGDDLVFPGRLKHVLLALVTFLYVDREKLTASQVEQQEKLKEIQDRLDEMNIRWRR